jgi:hypothetical protein
MPKFIPDPRAAYDKYPHETEIGCLNRKHRQIVNFKILRGRKNAKCPVCGRRAGKK